MKWRLLSLFLSATLFASERIEVYTNGWFKPEYLKELLCKSGSDYSVTELNIEPLKKRKLKLPLFSKRKVSKWIFMNVPRSAGRRFEFQRLPKEKMILFMWEPPVRLRKMYSDKVQRCFSKIYTFQDDLVDDKTYFKFHYPVLQPMRKNLPKFEEKRFCTMIVGATSDKSRHHPNELYSKRIEVIRFFEQNHPEDFEFYGYNWDAANYPSYRGALENKIAANTGYRFSICYENCRDVPGYITEKIFDCFAAGSIPIYWGANNVLDYIPKNCFIDRRDFTTLEALYQHLKSITNDQAETYLKNIREFLRSDKAQVFSRIEFERVLTDAVLDQT